MRGKDLCRAHFNQGSLAHGRVDESPQYWKLQHFLSAERRREQDGREPQKETQRKASSRNKKGLPHWYTRHCMWYYASDCSAVECVDELDEEQYNACLRQVNENYRKHMEFVQSRNSQGRMVVWVKRDQGPASYSDRADVAAASYNGEGGGQVFKWYRKHVFLRHLALRGVEPSSCSERQCVDALRATSIELQGQPVARAELGEYVGPQCFPQLQARLEANEQARGDSEGVQADGSGAVRDVAGESRQRAREQMRQCWRQCDACGKWRLLERGCV